MKQVSSVLLLTVLVQLAASKISNAVPSSIPRGYHGNLKVHQARPVRQLQYKTIEELQQESATPYSGDYYGQPAPENYREASPRTCGHFHKKEYHVEPVHVQPVYVQPQVHYQEVSVPVQHYQQIAVPETKYEQVTVPHTSYEHITVPHTEYHTVNVPQTEYQQISVPVQSYQSYQSYKPVYTSYKKPCYKSADEDTTNPEVSEFADPALRDTALYQAIGKSLGSGYDMNAPAPAMIAPEIPEYGRQAQYLNAPLPEMRAAYAPEMKSAYAPEMKAAYAPEMKAAYAPEMKAAYAPEMKAAIAPEMSRAVYADQRAVIAPEQRNAYLGESRSAQMYQDMNQRAAYAPEMSRAAYADQRAAIAPEWSRQAMYQPAYAGMYQGPAAPQYGSGFYPQPWGRNAEYQAAEKSATLEKAAAIPEGKPAPAAPQPANTESNPAKGKTETQSVHH
nr:PREDICTED: uncharacterized protein LOC109041344 [Bemisia tabaci]